MKRKGYFFEAIASFETLLRAYGRARRGKAGRPGAERFGRRLEIEILKLRDELLSRSYRPGPSVTFKIYDPKERQIAVAPFRDRVVHHAIMDAIQPELERRMDPDSYGCRPGKGTDGALARAQDLARRFPVCLKSDIQAVFASIRRDILLEQLRRIFKDARLLDLLDRIVRGGEPPDTRREPKLLGMPQSDPGRDRSERGLPLGNLTSQWLANLYLTAMDRHIRQLPEHRGLVRYMDDFLIFAASKEDARRLRASVESFLDENLGLKIKASVTQIYHCASGVPFLGFRLRPRELQLRRPTWARFQRQMRRLWWWRREGRISEESLAERSQSLIAHIRRARSHGLRRALLGRMIETGA